MNALRIAITFLFFGTAWILASDRAVELFAPDMFMSTLWQSLKGLTFVGLSGLLIYLLVRRTENTRAALTDEAARQRDRLSYILDVSPAVIYSLRPSTPGQLWKVDFVSHKIEQISGLSVQAWQGNPGLWRELLHPDDQERVLQDRALLKTQGWLHHEYRLRHASGHYRWINDHMVLMRDTSGRPIGVIGAWLDVHDRHQDGERIAHLANYDALTGLPNRHLLLERSQQALAQASRQQRPAVVMHLNIDHFSAVNETLGHEAGDELLRQMAQRITRTLRPQDTASRLGADDFILLLPDACAREAAQLSLRLMAAVAEPLAVAGQELRLTASIGVADYPSNGADLAALSQAAESAVHQAKREGRNTVRFATREIQEQLRETLTLTRELRWAVERQQLELFYQPQMSMCGLRLTGMEALVRWRHPEHGLLPPSRFISLAEEAGLIQEVGDWVLDEALRQLANWRAQGLPVVPVAINLSAAQFRRPDLCASLVGALEQHGLPAQLLELELTESVAMDDSERTQATLAMLKQLGLRLAIDDFGTGHSSLSYLRRFAIDKLKIDRCFVRDLREGTQDDAIITAIINLARSLNLSTVAEGVETREQQQLLCRRGCDLLQGYLFSEPVPAHAMHTLLAQQTQASSCEQPSCSSSTAQAQPSVPHGATLPNPPMR